MAQPEGEQAERRAVEGAAQRTATDGASQSRRARPAPVAAVRRRYAGSMAQDIGRRLSALDVANQATLLGAGLLASLLPLLILLSAFANERVDDDIALRLGLDHRGQAIITGLFHASRATLSVATLTSLLLVVAGTVAVASSLQQIYEKVFGQPRRGRRDLPRLLLWVAAMCVGIALESIVGRPALHAGGRGLILLVSFATVSPFFWWTMHFLLGGRVGWRRLLPSAVATGTFFVVFGVLSQLYFSAAIIADSRTFGSIGAVFALLSWLIAMSLVLILGVLAGAVWRERHPQAGQPGESRARPDAVSKTGAIHDPSA